VQELTPGERYKNIVQDMQLVARANLIFGLHVHVGIEDREVLIQMMNHARYSFRIYWRCRPIRRSGWGWTRGCTPTAARCLTISADESARLFPELGRIRNYVKLLVKTNSIDNARKIWWTCVRIRSSTRWSSACAISDAG